MSEPEASFEQIRAAIDAADDALAEALEARARAVLDLKQLRERHPDAYLDAPRDSDVLARLSERAGQFPSGALRSVVTEVLSASANLIAPVRIAYLGQEGGFGHVAARKRFGSSATLLPTPHEDAVLSEVERGNASYGLLPFETSNDGAVTKTLNLLARSDAKICGEVTVKREFHLLSPDGEMRDFSHIYASSSALSATEEFLAQHFPDTTVIDTRNGLVAAARAGEHERAAAIGTEVLADLAGLKYVKRSIDDTQDLATRYVAVGNDSPARTGNDRTALVLGLHDAPGVLLDCLRPFAERKINLERLETRPARGWEWRYLTLFELEGHITDRPVLTAIGELRTSSRYVKVLGSYPRSS